MGKARDQEENDRLFLGATVTDLAKLFGGSQNDVLKKIGGRVRPATPPGVKPIRYRVREAAPYLVEHTLDAEMTEAIIKRMSPEKLPAKLSDVFWKGQKARLDYQERQGELWKTERVVEILAEAFKPAAITIKMFRDTVGQMTELTAEQREILQELSDGLLRDLQGSLVEKFADYQPADDEHGMPISDAEGDGTVTVRLDLGDEEEEDDGLGD